MPHKHATQRHPSSTLRPRTSIRAPAAHQHPSFGRAPSTGHTQHVQAGLGSVSAGWIVCSAAGCRPAAVECLLPWVASRRSFLSADVVRGRVCAQAEASLAVCKSARPPRTERQVVCTAPAPQRCNMERPAATSSSLVAAKLAEVQRQQPGPCMCGALSCGHRSLVLGTRRVPKAMECLFIVSPPLYLGWHR